MLLTTSNNDDSSSVSWANTRSTTNFSWRELLCRTTWRNFFIFSIFSHLTDSGRCTLISTSMLIYTGLPEMAFLDKSLQKKKSSCWCNHVHSRLNGSINTCQVLLMTRFIALALLSNWLFFYYCYRSHFTMRLAASWFIFKVILIIWPSSPSPATFRVFWKSSPTSPRRSRSRGSTSC